MTFQRGTQYGLDSDPGESWREWAACQGTDGDMFFPPEGGSAQAAKRICRRCPVRLDCLEYALERDEKFGVWGGTVTKEREEIARCRSGRCMHPEHDPVDDDARLVRTVAELAGQGLTDRQIGRRVGRTTDQISVIRREHGIPAGWYVRGAR